MENQESEIKTTEIEESGPIGNFIQLIDSDEEFFSNFGEFLKQFDISPLDYFIISTFGPQSTGKSTLLNMLFSTDFPTMDQAKGRYQCTKGVYCSYPKNFKNLLVFDLEGTDAGVRGDDKSFERKISIFALAASEVLIVNNLLTDIGRYVGSNLSLLHTCFQMNIKLFHTMKKDRKTLLLFTLRDYDPETNFGKLKSQIMISVQEVWGKVMKPPSLKDCKLEDFFDFRFVTLPHFRYKKEEFVHKVGEMRTMFQSESSAFVYEKESYSHHIPIDDLPHYLNDIWTVTKENKDVDIPTQRKMLAMFRCDEISMDLIKLLDEEKFNKWKKTIQEKKKSVKELGKKALALIIKYLDEFDRSTELYLPQVVSEKRELLEKRLREKFRIECGQEQLELAVKNSVDFFKQYVDKKMDSSGKSKKRMKKFAKEIRNVKSATLKFFEKYSVDCFLPDEKESNLIVFKEREEKLAIEIERYSEVLRNQQLSMMIDEMKDNFSDTIQSHLKKLLVKPKKDFWDRTRKVLSSLLRSSEDDDLKFPEDPQENVSGEEQIFRKEMTFGFECSQEEIQKYLLDMKKFIFGTGVGTIRGYVKYLPSEMMKAFENEFPPRLEGRSGKVFTKYKRGRSAGLRLLNLFFFHRFHYVGTKSVVEKIGRRKLEEEGDIEPKDEEVEGEEEVGNKEELEVFYKKYYESLDSLRIGFPSPEESVNPSSIVELFYPDLEEALVNNQEERTIFVEDDVLRKYNEFQHKIDIKYMQAKSMESRYNIPWWLYFVILGLGWNELWFVLRNPLLLIAILVVFVLFGWNRLKNYIETALIDHEFNPMVDFAIRRFVSSLPQVFGRNFGVQKEEKEEFDEDEHAIPNQRNKSAKKINYGDNDENESSSDSEIGEDVRKRDLKED